MPSKTTRDGLHSGFAVVSDSGDEYKKLLVERCISNAVDARNNLVPGRVGTGSAEMSEPGRNDRRIGFGDLHPDSEIVIIKIEDAWKTIL